MHSFSNFEPLHWSMSSCKCCFCPAYSFLRRQVWWSGIPISLTIFHSLLWSTESKTCVVNEVEVDVFLEFPFFFYGPVDVGNLISGSSAFSEPSLYIWKFLVPVLLNPSVKDFEHNFTSIWNERSCTIAGTLLTIALLWDWDENWLFPVLWPQLSFPNLLSYWGQHFNSIMF